MGKSLVALSVFSAALLSPNLPFGLFSSATNTFDGNIFAPPLPPDTSIPKKEVAVDQKEVSPPPKPAKIESLPAKKPVVKKIASTPKVVADPTPIRLSIPSIKLNASVVPVGINAKGEMDVPEGSTKKLGWYNKGPKPGEMGSAVIDAHVYAGFAKLRYVKVGDSIYVRGKDNTLRRFVVESSMVYPVGDVPLDALFLRDDAKRLNLITCAGKLTKDRSTYEKRLIVYAKLAE